MSYNRRNTVLYELGLNFIILSCCSCIHIHVYVFCMICVHSHKFILLMDSIYSDWTLYG